MDDSIIQHDRYCFFCHRNNGTLQIHHCIHGTANRRLAEEDGLKVYLCPTCHKNLHDKGKGDRDLQRLAEEMWIEKHYFYDREKGIEEFIERYGKSYL